MPTDRNVLDLITLGKLDKQSLRDSGAGRLTPVSVTHPRILTGRPRLRTAIRRRLVRLPTPVRRPGRKADRYLQFVIETKKPIQSNDEILKPVRKAMNASQLGANTVANNLKVEPLFPGANPNDRVTKLARYYLLVVPISFQNAFLMVKKRFGAFWDLAYQIREAGKPEFVLVDPDIPAEFYMRPLQANIPGCWAGEAPVTQGPWLGP